MQSMAFIAQGTIIRPSIAGGVKRHRCISQLRSRKHARSVILRAEGDVQSQVKDAADAEFKRIDNDIVEPLKEGAPVTSEDNSWDQSIIEAGKKETETLGTEKSFGDIMRFRAYPEVINSRLAMIGVTTGYITKALTGVNTFTQYAKAPVPVIATFVLFIFASLYPIAKGLTPEKAENGIWTVQAEKTNGRLAMLGFVALLATDGWQLFIANQVSKAANL